DHSIGLGIIDHDLDPDLRQEVHRVPGAAVDLRIALLSRVAFSLGDRHALYADAPQCFAHVVEPEWFDDGDDQLPRLFPVGRLTTTADVTRGFPTRVLISMRNAHIIGALPKD